MENAAFVVKNRHLTEYIGNNEYIEIPEAVTVIDDFAFEGLSVYLLRSTV